MLIAGFQKLTLLDYPGKIAALIFTQGCNFACGYCHNPEMIPSLRILPERPELDPEWILSFLATRKGLLDGVVVSGGEPTLHQDLPDFLKKIKNLGFLTKLDTNGSHPEVLSNLIDKKLVDYIAMDIKASPKNYADLVKHDDLGRILTSIRVIMDSSIDSEFRSTIFPSLHKPHEIKAMGTMIRGAKRWYLQNFRPLRTLDQKFQQQRSFDPEELNTFALLAKEYIQKVDIRT